MSNTQFEARLSALETYGKNEIERLLKLKRFSKNNFQP